MKKLLASFGEMLGSMDKYFDSLFHKIHALAPIFGHRLIQEIT